MSVHVLLSFPLKCFLVSDLNLPHCNASQSLLFPSHPLCSNSVHMDSIFPSISSRRNNSQSFPITFTGNTSEICACSWCPPLNSLPVTLHLQKHLKATSLKSDVLLLPKRRNRVLKVNGKALKMLKKSHTTIQEWWNPHFLQFLCYIIEEYFSYLLSPCSSHCQKTSRDQQKVAGNGCDYTENSENTE